MRIWIGQKVGTFHISGECFGNITDINGNGFITVKFKHGKQHTFNPNIVHEFLNFVGEDGLFVDFKDTKSKVLAIREATDNYLKSRKVTS